MVNCKFFYYLRYCLLLIVCAGVTGQHAFAGKKAGGILTPGTIAMAAGKNTFAPNQIPDNIVEILPALSSAAGQLVYQWETSSSPVTGFTPVTGATQTGFTFSSPLLQTTYFRRKVTDALGNIDSSNIIQVTLVSVNHENINYVREHDILVTGVTDWKTADLLPIGQKLQTTTYSDGLGRPIQKLSRETATPPDPASGALWGDVVQFISYDAFGRSTRQYLPYTTTTEPGRLKTATYAVQEQYYSSHYQETNPYTSIEYESNPLGRVRNQKAPGQPWAAGAGNTKEYELNNAEDGVRILGIGYEENATPVVMGVYPEKTLFKNKYTDENGKQVIEFVTSNGQLILKKIQLDDNPGSGTTGWICTYSVYDDYGRLRFVLQPEAVRFMETNNWQFSAAHADQVVNEWCFRYNYDEKGRNVYKKAPGAQPLLLVYDNRDRVVCMQDGNQRAKPVPEWTVNVYDELDRLTVTAPVQNH